MRRKLSYLRRLALPARSHIMQKYAGPVDPGRLSLLYGVRLKANLGRYLKAILALLKKNEEITREADREIEQMDMLEWFGGHLNQKH